jgi:hypothetical protein
MFRDLGISERIKLDALYRQWCNIFSGPLADHTAPVDLKEGLLVIAVDSPAWLQHLKFLKNEILAKLKSHGIKDIRLKHGNIRQDRDSGKSDKNQDQVIYRQLTAEETDSIERAVTEIEDVELQDAIRQVLEKSLRRKRS